MAGIVILLAGVYNLSRALEVQKAGGGAGTALLVLSLVTIVLGVLTMFNLFRPENVLIRILGAVLVYNGLVGLIAGAKGK